MVRRILLFTLVITSCRLWAQPHSQVKDNSDRILHFASGLNVHKDGSILVTENITVFNGDGRSGSYDNGMMLESHNNAIEHGIYREFPTRYKDTSGFFANRGFHLKSVLKDGKREPYSTESLENGVRVKIGDKNTVLEPGTYQYTLVYETNRQILFEQDKDELYWNVNGNGWMFAVDTASCVISFPEGAEVQQNACYTGIQGASEHNCSSQVTGGNTISFQTTTKLSPYEGLSVAAAIQKGVIVPPGKLSNAVTFMRSNSIIPVLASIILFLFVFYYITWYRKGRDPAKGVVYPHFSPPEGLTAPDCGYIAEQRCGPHLFTAALVQCAVKKQLGIQITREGLIFKTNVYHFVQPQQATDATGTANQYGFDIGTLYGETARKGTYNATLKSCYDALSAALADRFEIRRGRQSKVYGVFALNKGYTQFGFFVILASIFLSVQFIVQHPSLKLVVITCAMLVVLFIIHNVFARIMSAYTKQGRDIVDHLLGFKLYLETAEQPVYNQLAPPEKTLDLFEKYLPYAIALKVENAWASKFEEIMYKALEQGYTPTYYSMGGGGYNSFSMTDMSHGISSGLSGTLSSAATPPSSSGSGGGGSSGGGGGGGGGGGW